MTKVGGQFIYVLLDIDACPVPVKQRLDSESVSEIMYPWAMSPRGLSQADLARQSNKGSPHITFPQASTSVGDEEAWAPSYWKEPVSTSPVTPKLFLR